MELRFAVDVAGESARAKIDLAEACQDCNRDGASTSFVISGARAAQTHEQQRQAASLTTVLNAQRPSRPCQHPGAQALRWPLRELRRSGHPRRVQGPS